ncbi:hypothetical protein LguiA_016008 [Lonicera macranthoides]
MLALASKPMLQFSIPGENKSVRFSSFTDSSGKEMKYSGVTSGWVLTTFFPLERRSSCAIANAFVSVLSVLNGILSDSKPRLPGICSTDNGFKSGVTEGVARFSMSASYFAISPSMDKPDVPS